MIHISTSHPEGVYYYMLFYLAAILIGIAGAGIAARKSKFSIREFAVIVSAGILSLIIGSKLVLFDSAQWLSLFSDGHLPVETGKSVLGAIIGGMIGVWVAGRLFRKNESVLDLFAVSFPLGMAVQRIGCLFAGCCHGIITSVPWGITYGPESRPFMEQQQLGLIPADAATSLAVHPDQIYHIIACIVIAIIAWKTSSRWKSPSGKFIFSIILYMVFRFVEEFTRFSPQPEEWMGLKIVQWKVLSLLVFLSLLLFSRERKYAHFELLLEEKGIRNPVNNLKIFLLSILVLSITIQIGGWLTGDEHTIIVYTVFPLCGFVILENLFWILLSQKYVKAGSLVLFAFILMSQKADKPAGTPENYTAFNLTSAFGKFDLDHEFNYRTWTGTDCNGNPHTYYGGDDVTYHHSYEVGGIGVSRKIFYNKWRSMELSFNLIAGTETEEPFYNPYLSFRPPSFKNTLWSINPMVQYDGRGIGLGLGGSFGDLGYDKSDAYINHGDYNPNENKRKASLQARLRFFNERKFFIEGLGGYDAGSVGHYNWQILVGSRFNSDKYMFKTGIASNLDNPSLVLHGNMLLFSNFFLSPKIIIPFVKDDSYSYPQNRYRVAIGLEYRFYNK